MLSGDNRVEADVRNEKYCLQIQKNYQVLIIENYISHITAHALFVIFMGIVNT